MIGKDKIGIGTMIWQMLIDKNEEFYALFDTNEPSCIRALAWHKKDLVKLRKKLRWSSDCKIKKVKMTWRMV